MKFLAHLFISTGLIVTVGLAISQAAFASPPQDYVKLIGEAQSLERDGESLASFIDYYQASLVKPAGTEANDALNRLLHDGLPTRIPEYVFDGARSSSNALRIDLLLNGQVLAISPSVGEIAPINDPQNNWPFTRLTYFYRLSTKPIGDWDCFAIVHSQTAEDQDLGTRMGRLLFVLRQALIQETTYVPLTDGKPFGVWLTRHATDKPGGEEWHDNIYFYDVTAKRSQIEWVREIAHEFSHLALPAIGGDYTDPEPWANGYYGERLLLRWLHRGAAGGQNAVEDAWGGTFAGYVNFDKLLVGPYLTDFNTLGLNRAQLNRTDGAGMRYLIGMLLAIDDHSGPKVLGDMLWSLPQTGQVDAILLYKPASEALAKPGIAPFQEAPEPVASASPSKPATVPEPSQDTPAKPALTPSPPPAKPSAVSKPAPPKPTNGQPPPPEAPPVMAH